MGNDVSLTVDDREAKRAIDQWQQIAHGSGPKIVRQLVTLGERYMKEESPTGVGIPEVNMRTTITSEEVSSDPFKMVVEPKKKTREGWPLHHAVVGEPDTPTYTDTKPPIEPLMNWAEAKLGDRQAAWAIRESIYQDGHSSFPDPFIDRSVKEWEGRTETTAQDVVDKAFRGGGGFGGGFGW